jgi:hypothetical protein
VTWAIIQMLYRMPSWAVAFLLRMPFPPFQWPYFAAAIVKLWQDGQTESAA